VLPDTLFNSLFIVSTAKKVYKVVGFCGLRVTLL